MTATRAVLLVDDDPDVHVLVRSRFRRTGRTDLELLHVNSAEAAVKQVPELMERLALVLSDVRMPGRDGHALLQDLRDIGYTGPFVLIGSLQTDGHRADAWVEKDRVFETIGELLTRYVP